MRYRVRIFSEKPMGLKIRKTGKASTRPWYCLSKKSGNYIYEIDIDNLKYLDEFEGCRFLIGKR